MKHIELHILQSFPVSCLNRDDVGSPKSALFGGVQRARISSQCLKRAARLEARELSPRFQGVRSRLIKKPFHNALLDAGLPAEEAEKKADELCLLFSKTDSKNPAQVTTAVYLSPGEVNQIAQAVAGGEDPKKAIKKATRTDAADIALFGRMVANDTTLNIEGAAMVSHALSTHKSINDIDYFSAVDDGKVDTEDAGAGMIGTLEFNASTYYRFVAINLDLLAAHSHLGELPKEERAAILRAFIEAVLVAVPGARKNSMNASTRPFEVLATVKERGHPVQLVNAFEKPVRANDSGYSEASKELMKTELANLKKLWGVEYREELWLTELGMPAMLDTLVKYV
ncbi:MAG: type I-E CRISPR-associated protein Cas7/Cse4/CasC [Verrucomicrobiota bacterium JB022]|nr:type I-E CRISPR-associated protein Cas7/Cse4/CasC [Verrucomicrobiota bacterium JB022]